MKATKYTFIIAKIILCIIGVELTPPIYLIATEKKLLSKECFTNATLDNKVHTWWHWINGNITKSGITKDLIAMKKQGITQATILNVGGFINPNLNVPNIKFGSNEWYEMLKYAFKEAQKLGITIGIHNCDGWSTSGGPWIKPEESMKKLVWSKKIITSKGKITTKIPQPQSHNNYYEDYVCLAYPISHEINSFVKAQPKMKVNKKNINSLLYDGNGSSGISLKDNDEIEIECAKDIDINKISLFSYLPFDWIDLNNLGTKFQLSYSIDGKEYYIITEFTIKKANKRENITFPTTHAKYFKIKCIKNSSNNFSLTELELLSEEEEPSFSPNFKNLYEKTALVYYNNPTDFNNITPNKTSNIIPLKDIIDITEVMQNDGSINWTPPSNGEWCLVRFGYTTTGITNAPATPEGIGLECDKLDSLSVIKHFNSFSGKIISECKEYIGNTFKFILVDSWECQYQNWTKTFPTEFQNLRGYEIRKWLPVLCGEIVESCKHSSAFLHDFRKTIADLISLNYYKILANLCHKNNLELHSEVIYGNNGMYPPLDILKSNKYVDVPMTEFWANPNENQIPIYTPVNNVTKEFPYYTGLSLGKEKIAAEAFTGFANYSESPDLLKPYGDLAFCSGVNQLIMHSYVHQPTDSIPGVTLAQFGGHYNRNNPWWNYSSNWYKYISRVQYILQHGRQVADILCYVGDNYPQYISNTYLKDIPSKYKAVPINYDILKNQIHIKDHRIYINEFDSYPFLLLSKQKQMDISTLKRLVELVNEGMTLVGNKPDMPLSLIDVNNKIEFDSLCNLLWIENADEKNLGKGKVIKNKAIPELISQFNILPSFKTDEIENNNLLFIHKKFHKYDIFYVFNQQNKYIKNFLYFKTRNKSPQIWNPYNGEILTPTIYKESEDYTIIPMTLKPHESLFFIFKEKHNKPSIVNVKYNNIEIFPNVFEKNQYCFNLFEEKNSLDEIQSGMYEFQFSNNKNIKRYIEKDSIFNLNISTINVEFTPCYSDHIHPIKIKQFSSLSDFNDLPIKYFSGKLKYEIIFKADSFTRSNLYNWYLCINKFSAIAEIYLNGKYLDNIWMPNSEIKLPQLQAENKLEIIILTTCRNRLIGDLVLYDDIKSLYTTSPIKKLLNKNMPLSPTGILSPLKLKRKYKGKYIF